MYYIKIYVEIDYVQCKHEHSSNILFRCITLKCDIF